MISRLDLDPNQIQILQVGARLYMDPTQPKWPIGEKSFAMDITQPARLGQGHSLPGSI